jgi:hypothetical protein
MSHYKVPKYKIAIIIGVTFMKPKIDGVRNMAVEAKYNLVISKGSKEHFTLWPSNMEVSCQSFGENSKKWAINDRN